MRLAPPAFLLLFVTAAAAQVPQWVPRNMTPQPGSAGASAFAFDAARGRCVYFTWTRETWTYDGAVWSPQINQTGPTNAYQAGGSCYDSGRQVVVMVAGDNSTGLETWEWGGTMWTRRAIGGILARRNFALTYDAARGQTLLFGGSRGPSVGLADLWSWDGSAWTQIYNGGPPPRSSAAMVYDAARQTVVLFGGDSNLGSSTIRYGDTWEWNGAHWINHFGIPGPQGRAYSSLVYDAARQRVVLVGGASSSVSYSDTWEWDGLSWSQTIATGSPLGLMAYDSVREVTVAVGGLPGATTEYVTAANEVATFTTFGAGCQGPNGVPQLAAAPGSTPRIGATLQLSLTNLPPSFLNPAFGIVGFGASTWNGQPLPVSLASIGMPGCSAWIEPVFADVLVNVQGTANWNLVLPMNQHFIGLDLYVQGAVLSPGTNAAGVVLSNAGHAHVGTP